MNYLVDAEGDFYFMNNAPSILVSEFENINGREKYNA